MPDAGSRPHGGSPQPTRGTFEVLGGIHVHPPTGELDGLHAVAGVNEEVDRVRELELASLGGGDEPTGVEEWRREHEKPGEGEVRRRIGRFLDHGTHPPALHDRDASLPGLDGGYVLHRDGRRGGSLPVVVEDGGRVGVDDVVPVDDHEVAVDGRLGRKDGVREPGGFVLVDVSDRNAPVRPPEVIDDRVRPIPDDHDQRRDVERDERVEDASQQWLAGHLEEPFRPVLGQWSETSPLACRGNDGQHGTEQADHPGESFVGTSSNVDTNVYYPSKSMRGSMTGLESPALARRHRLPPDLSSTGKLVYLYLSECGDASLEDLKASLGVPLIRLYPTVKSLEQRGLIDRTGDVCAVSR